MRHWTRKFRNWIVSWQGNDFFEIIKDSFEFLWTFKFNTKRLHETNWIFVFVEYWFFHLKLFLLRLFCFSLEIFSIIAIRTDYEHSEGPQLFKQISKWESCHAYIKLFMTAPFKITFTLMTFTSNTKGSKNYVLTSSEALTDKSSNASK